MPNTDYPYMAGKQFYMTMSNFFGGSSTFTGLTLYQTFSAVRRSRDEWDKLAKWVVGNKLFSNNVRWLIQVPRLYDIYKRSGSIDSFAQIITS